MFDKLPADAAPRFEPSDYDVAIIGDYNIGGDAWSSRILLEEMIARDLRPRSASNMVRIPSNFVHGVASVDVAV